MKFFTNKKVIQKIVIILLLVISCNLIIPTSTVHAGIFGEVVNAIGGFIVPPVVTLITTIADAGLNGLQNFMIGNEAPDEFMVDRDDDDQYYAPTDNAAANAELEGEYDGMLWGLGDYQIPVVKYSPDEIFSNRVPILDANFIRSARTSGNEETDNAIIKLREVVASWYVAIRMIAIVGLLSVLVYIAIRMMMSGIAEDKAKYKKMLMSWVVALCLLFFLHYIMSFIMTLSEMITGFVSTNASTAINVNLNNGEQEFSTNLIGLVRFQIQHTSTLKKFTYMMVYIMLVVYTIKFTWIYLKRVLTMAFLTLIAPFIALTYPIDKAGDGKAQAFDMWIKEYTFTALTQPLHCLIYTVFTSATIALSKENPLLAIIIFPCMGYAEKFLKSLFGFTKAPGDTQPSLAKPLAAGAIGHAVADLAKMQTKADKESKPRTKDSQVSNPSEISDSYDMGDGTGLTFPANTQRTQDAQNQGGGNSAQQNVQPESDGQNVDNEEENNIDPNTEELMRQQQEILDDPNVTDEQRQEAQEELNYLRGSDDDLANQQQQWANGRTKDDEYDEDNEEKPMGNAISDTAGKGAEGLESGNGEETAGKFARNKAGLADNTSKEDGIGLSVYKGVKRNIKGAVRALPAVAYKGATGAAKAMAGATVGAATWAIAAAATGDMSKATTLAGTAAVGTYHGLNAGQRKIENMAGVDTSVGSAFEKGKYGSELKAREEKQQKAFENSDELKRFLDEQYKGKSKAEKEKAKRAMSTYNKYGIKDIEKQHKLYKLEETMQNNSTYMSEIGGKKLDRREMASSYKARQKADSKAWTDNKVYEQEVQRQAKRLSGTEEQKISKARRKMAAARIMYDNRL